MMLITERNLFNGETALLLLNELLKRYKGIDDYRAGRHSSRFVGLGMRPSSERLMIFPRTAAPPLARGRAEMPEL